MLRRFLSCAVTENGSAVAGFLPLVSREWKNGSNSSYNCTPFLHSLLTKGKAFQVSLVLLLGTPKSFLRLVS